MSSKKKSTNKKSSVLDQKYTVNDLNTQFEDLKNLWFDVSTKIAELKTQIEPLEKKRDDLVVRLHETCKLIKLN